MKSSDTGLESGRALPATEQRQPQPIRPKRRSPGIRRRIVALGVPAAILVLFFGGWELASASGWQPSYILPSPTVVLADLWHNSSAYWSEAQFTLEEVAWGLLCGVLLGLIAGAIIGLVPALRRGVYPLVVASQSLPVLALAPLLVLWFGFGLLPKVIIVVQAVFFPITVATIGGLASVSQDALIFGRSLGATWWQLFWKVRVPASLPQIFNGLKISASYSAIAAVIAEWAGSQRGLGASMLLADSNLGTTTVFSLLTIVTLIGLTVFGLASLLERLIIPWHERFRR